VALPKMRLMDNVSRPLIAVLAATVALFALYFVALRGSPKSATSAGTSSQSLKGYQSDISAAQNAVAVSGANDAASGGGSDGAKTQPPDTGLVAHSSGATTAAKSSGSASAHSAATSASATNGKAGSKVTVTVAHASSAAQHRVNVVTAALASKKVLALLFYNPAAADDRAVKQELASVPTRRHSVVKLAVPISELARYQVVTTQVPVSQSPTLVVIDRGQQATTIVGYASGYEIAQRVDDALAAK
jgi:hypothetical protein